MKKIKLLSILIMFLAMGSIVFNSCKKDDDANVESVALDATSKALKVGETFTLAATITPTGAKNKDITWGSSNSAVAVVSSDGTVTAISIGTATITVTTDEGAKTATCAVTVATNVVSVTGVTLDQTSATLKAGSTLTLVPTIAPADATIKTVTWSSSDVSIASVDATGKVTALKSGTVTITVTAENSKTATCTLTIAEASYILQGEISGTRTLSADTVYLIKGFIYIVDGGTLNIPAGTILRGDKATKGTIIAERGGKLIANGTKEKPIIFTSNVDAGGRTYGDWGGIILCGKATQNQTDPIVEGGPRTHYGGTDDADNSGSLNYCRIEFPGIPLAADKEINGLTLCAVGSGTTISHIQVSYSGDDSYEWFGGAVKCDHLVALRGTDDEYDTDFGFHGSVQFALGIRDPRKADYSGSNGFESDNDADGHTYTPFTSAVFSNITLIGPLDVITQTNYAGDFKRALHIRRASQLKAYNSVFAGWPVGLLIDQAYGNTWETAKAGTGMEMKNCIMVGMKDKYFDASGSGFTATDVHDWYFADTRHNDTITTTVNAGINQLFFLKDKSKDPDAGSLTLTTGFVLPTAGSRLLTGASFDDEHVSGLTHTDYRGAFGTTDWTDGWVNWTPQSTVYPAPGPKVAK
jgi:hypothetical protein